MKPGRIRRLKRFDAVEWSTLFRTEQRSSTVDVALIAVRIALAWIFVYYGAQKLFGAFNGPGLHSTALYFAHTAHLRPGELFAVLGGVAEFGGAITIALGFCSRLAALALFGDQVVAMITVTWVNGFGSLTGGTGYPFNVTLAVLALVVVALGAGRVSIDNVIAGRLRAVGTRGSLRPPASPEHLHHPDESGQPVTSTIGTNDAE